MGKIIFLLVQNRTKLSVLPFCHFVSVSVSVFVSLFVPFNLRAFLSRYSDQIGWVNANTFGK